ncbi:Transcription factor vrtR1 [Exophiala dermatitidis]
MYDQPVVKEGSGNADAAQARVMPYTCQPCARRKVKCDKVAPTCSSCIKGKIECFYEAPPPRRPKRKRNETVFERVARYERTLQDNGLLPSTGVASPSYMETPQSIQNSSLLPDSQSLSSKSGKLVAGEGKARYVNSSLWRELGEEEMSQISHEEEDDKRTPAETTPSTEDLISSALLGLSHNLVDYHPKHSDAMKLWAVYVANVEPLCKVLHVPSMSRMVDAVSQRPSAASKAQECLLFAIYHIAVYSMTDEDCMREFGQAQASLLAKYQHAIRQALVNASWLKTTDMLVMQAFVLFLIAVRTQIDPHTFWILSGVAVRISQRMGLHHDGEKLGLPPFEVQMRRRLFWQLLPLDGYAGQVSGTGIMISPTSWDTKQPSNINDCQIYPGMPQQPVEQKGATEMMFVLARTELTRFYTQTGVRMKDLGGAVELKETVELERIVDEVENIAETKYLRYCDITDPLHFLTLGVVRSAANAVRLHSKMPQLMNQSIGDHERRHLCALAHKVLDADSAAYSHPKMKRYHWSFKGFFLGDAIICILTSIAKVGFFSSEELAAAWDKVAEVYTNHAEILQAKRAIHIAVGTVTLKAWMANPPKNSMPEPSFITALRSTQCGNKLSRSPESKAIGVGNRNESGKSLPVNEADAVFGNFDDTDFTLGNSLVPDGSEWLFWDQLIHDYETIPI